MDTLTEMLQPQNWQQLFLMAASVIILGVARELAACIIRRLQQLEKDLQRNTRETIRARREAEKANICLQRHPPGARRVTDAPEGEECQELPTQPRKRVGLAPLR